MESEYFPHFRPGRGGDVGGGMEEGRRNCQSLLLLLLLLSPFQVIHASESAAGRRRSEILRRENSERGKDAPKILTSKTLQELCRFFSFTPPHRSITVARNRGLTTFFLAFKSVVEGKGGGKGSFSKEIH